MTKAVMRSMDTLTDWWQKMSGKTLEKFFVSGASKRGWTTWTVAAVDSRVIGQIPVVFDCLNFIKNIHHMYPAYGGWSFALKDYWEVGYTAHLDDEANFELANVVDPYYYRDRYAGMPKLVVDATDDEFLQNDNDQAWWDDMPGPKTRLMCQNAEHSMATGLPEAIPSICAWINGILSGFPEPKFTWVIAANDTHGTITVTNDPTNGRPENVTMWYSQSYKAALRRDWRILGGYPDQTVQPLLWRAIQLDEEAGGNVWIATQEIPTRLDEWFGFFVEMTYPGPKGYMYNETKFHLTTQVSIVPKDTWYGPDCYGASCYGTLV